MTSQPLDMKPHPVCRATYTLYMRHHTHYLCPHTHCIDNSIPIFVWHHTCHICGIVCPIQDITSSLYDLKPPFYVITPTTFDIVFTVSVSSHPLYWWYHTNCISESTSAIIHDIISIVYDMTPTLCVTSYALYITTYQLLMSSQYCKVISLQLIKINEK